MDKAQLKVMTDAGALVACALDGRLTLWWADARLVPGKRKR